MRRSDLRQLKLLTFASADDKAASCASNCTPNQVTLLYLPAIPLFDSAIDDVV